MAMRWLLDGAYMLAAVLTMPIWMMRMVRTGKIRTDWLGRFGAGAALPAKRDGRPRLLIHAVSVGELNAVRNLVEQLDSGPDAPELVIATTTDTGYSHAKHQFAERIPVVRYPFDVSASIERFLDRVRPDTVALVELEVWPNLLDVCERRAIPVLVINGRLSERSASRYKLIGWIMRQTYRKIHRVAAQSQVYADRFETLGVPRERILVLGTMKWDTATICDEVPGADALAEAMGIDRSRPLVVAGSTAPGEHELLQEVTPRGVQLLCAPRKPEWFDQAAASLPGCVRRSSGARGSEAGRFLLDTIGELRQAYALADLVVVGRTFVPLGGSDMIEPIALGKPAIVGPHVENFLDAAQILLEAGGLVQTSRQQFPTVLRRLLDDAEACRQLVLCGRGTIRDQQGATARHAEVLNEALRLRSCGGLEP